MAPESLVVGVLYAPGVSRDLIEELAAQLPDEPQARFANAGWRTEVSEQIPPSRWQRATRSSMPSGGRCSNETGTSLSA
jgi:hypothetical protein